MKIQTLFLVFGLFSVEAIADETNWVTAAPQFREIDGQLYNTDLSKKFENFGGTVVAVLTNAVVLESKREILVGNINPLATIQAEDFVVTNFPMDFQPTVGSNQRGRAMRIGSIKYNGEVLKLYDFGSPHRVLIVSTNEIKIPAGIHKTQ